MAVVDTLASDVNDVVDSVTDNVCGEGSELVGRRILLALGYNGPYTVQCKGNHFWCSGTLCQ